MPLSLKKSALLFVIAAATAACSGSAPEVEESTTPLALKRTKKDKSRTIENPNGSCSSPDGLIQAHDAELRSLCADGGSGAEGTPLPMPSGSSTGDCAAGEVVSITFECVEASVPPVPADGCRVIPVQDETNAFASGGAEYVSSLHGVVCPLIGAAPPRAPTGAVGGAPPRAPTGAVGGAPPRAPRAPTDAVGGAPPRAPRAPTDAVGGAPPRSGGPAAPPAPLPGEPVQNAPRRTAGPLPPDGVVRPGIECCAVRPGEGYPVSGEPRHAPAPTASAGTN